MQEGAQVHKAPNDRRGTRSCGHHIHPTAGTIFERSSTSLQLWFYAIHLMTSTRCGVSAKQLERELGVTYKTAWRMFNRIRHELMAEDDEPLTGEVEIDETSVDGKPRSTTCPARTTTTLEGGAARANVVEQPCSPPSNVADGSRPPSCRPDAVPASEAGDQWIVPDAVVYTDEWPAYNGLALHFASHSRVRHTAGEYVMGDAHTNTSRGSLGTSRPAIRGTYKKVSHKWLQGYLNEFTFRYNHRNAERSMFEELLRAATPRR